MAKGHLIVLSGPSGVGKGTVCNNVLSKCPQLVKSVSVTTRKPREGEKEGINYFFKTYREYLDIKNQNGFLETFEIYGNYYGTPRKFVEDNINKGLNVLLEIDVQGALEIKKKMAEAVLIFLMPPSMKQLEERLKGRNTEDAKSYRKRIEAAQTEIKSSAKYDYIVENDTVENAAANVLEIINKIKSC